MASNLQIDISEVVQNGPGLAFIGKHSDSMIEEWLFYVLSYTLININVCSLSGSCSLDAAATAVVSFGNDGIDF